MPRSAVMMSLLLSLFMFQSFWNVAAAFCQHETVVTAQITPQHFGHHLSHQQDLDSKNQAVEQGTERQSAALTHDHHSHLPSCLHVVMRDVQQHADAPVLFTTQLAQRYHWFNFYQSPDLSLATPPPLFAPLLVG